MRHQKRLEGIGHRHAGDNGIPGREVYKRETTGNFMEYHMYVCPSGSAELTQHLKLRDYTLAKEQRNDTNA
ncbi:MAG: GrpB family protein [Defluviitaleaceae bacterium]|nr:GrpB family protein [Defluviitaleaceae bacterium]